MKFTLALLFSALLAAPLMAQEAPPPLSADAQAASNTPHAANYLRTYLQCNRAAALAKGGDINSLPCFDRISVRYCEEFNRLPADVQQSIALEVYCNFIASEQTGDAANDTAVMQTASAAGCFQGDHIRRTVRVKHRGDANVEDALQHYTKGLMENEAICAANLGKAAQ